MKAVNGGAGNANVVALLHGTRYGWKTLDDADAKKAW
jgi:hypothetical protein